jgi:uncharacterized membrane protein YhaH (DUF805 family)
MILNQEIELEVASSRLGLDDLKDNLILQFILVIAVMLFSVFLLFSWAMMSSYVTHEANIPNEFFRGVFWLFLCCIPVYVCTPCIYSLDRYYFKTRHEEERGRMDIRVLV